MTIPAIAPPESPFGPGMIAEELAPSFDSALAREEGEAEGGGVQHEKVVTPPPQSTSLNKFVQIQLPLTPGMVMFFTILRKHYLKDKLESISSYSRQLTLIAQYRLALRPASTLIAARPVIRHLI